ncbi:UDP-glucuronosyltransferase 2A1-like [Elysia marginata]|uniref:UDP-glucuronosyltransferase 2A1-like n=1 Tax=Elysia marginata TaxID=1093978 RepID=A0AAV4J9P1_9GAST|nr:UDP-glucuronosyltransferase 2A1-like [Elysia marginata]
MRPVLHLSVTNKTHVTRHDSLSKTILQGTVKGKRRRGRQKKAWCDNIKEWPGMVMCELVRSASDRDAWRQKLILLPSDPPDDPTGRGTEVRPLPAKSLSKLTEEQQIKHLTLAI